MSGTATLAPLPATAVAPAVTGMVIPVQILVTDIVSQALSGMDSRVCTLEVLLVAVRITRCGMVYVVSNVILAADSTIASPVTHGTATLVSNPSRLCQSLQSTHLVRVVTHRSYQLLQSHLARVVVRVKLIQFRPNLSHKSFQLAHLAKVVANRSYQLLQSHLARAVGKVKLIQFRPNPSHKSFQPTHLARAVAKRRQSFHPTL
jgi:hypothetical protein